MSLRKSTAGRPSGTDGSDFSYRMVVDPSEINIASIVASYSFLLYLFLIGTNCRFFLSRIFESGWRQVSPVQIVSCPGELR